MNNTVEVVHLYSNTPKLSSCANAIRKISSLECYVCNLQSNTGSALPFQYVSFIILSYTATVPYILLNQQDSVHKWYFTPSYVGIWLFLLSWPLTHTDFFFFFQGWAIHYWIALDYASELTVVSLSPDRNLCISMFMFSTDALRSRSNAVVYPCWIFTIKTSHTNCQKLCVGVSFWAPELAAETDEICDTGGIYGSKVYEGVKLLDASAYQYRTLSCRTYIHFSTPGLRTKVVNHVSCWGYKSKTDPLLSQDDDSPSILSASAMD